MGGQGATSSMTSLHNGTAGWQEAAMLSMKMHLQWHGGNEYCVAMPTLTHCAPVSQVRPAAGAANGCAANGDDANGCGRSHNSCRRRAAAHVMWPAS